MNKLIFEIENNVFEYGINLTLDNNLIIEKQFNNVTLEEHLLFEEYVINNKKIFGQLFLDNIEFPKIELTKLYQKGYFFYNLTLQKIHILLFNHYIEKIFKFKYEIINNSIIEISTNKKVTKDVILNNGEFVEGFNFDRIIVLTEELKFKTSRNFIIHKNLFKETIDEITNKN